MYTQFLELSWTSSLLSRWLIMESGRYFLSSGILHNLSTPSSVKFTSKTREKELSVQQLGETNLSPINFELCSLVSGSCPPLWYGFLGVQLVCNCDIVLPGSSPMEFPRFTRISKPSGRRDWVGWLPRQLSRTEATSSIYTEARTGGAAHHPRSNDFRP